MKDLNINISELVIDIAKTIHSDIKNVEELILVGIVTRGFPLAQRIAKQLELLYKQEIPVGKLDITLYRDDLSRQDDIIKLKETFMPAPIEGKTIILIDDVLFHGRTVRAAIDNILDYGRPNKISLAVLVDRGHKELPICANYIGTKIETSINDKVQVLLQELDGKDKVEINETT